MGMFGSCSSLATINASSLSFAGVEYKIEEGDGGGDIDNNGGIC